MCVCVLFFQMQFPFSFIEPSSRGKRGGWGEGCRRAERKNEDKVVLWLLNFTHSNWDLNFVFPFHLLFFLFLFFFYSNFSFSLDLPFHLSKGQRCVEQIRRITKALTAVVENAVQWSAPTSQTFCRVCALHSTIVLQTYFSVYGVFFVVEQSFWGPRERVVYPSGVGTPPWKSSANFKLSPFSLGAYF
mgnify:CR=1 FL=1